MTFTKPQGHSFIWPEWADSVVAFVFFFRVVVLFISCVRHRRHVVITLSASCWSNARGGRPTQFHLNDNQRKKGIFVFHAVKVKVFVNVLWKFKRTTFALDSYPRFDKIDCCSAHCCCCCWARLIGNDAVSLIGQKSDYPPLGMSTLKMRWEEEKTKNETRGKHEENRPN